MWKRAEDGTAAVPVGAPRLWMRLVRTYVEEEDARRQVSPGDFYSSWAVDGTVEQNDLLRNSPTQPPPHTPNTLSLSQSFWDEDDR